MMRVLDESFSAKGRPADWRSPGPELHYAEKARAIRYSMRCLAVGVLASLPPLNILLCFVGLELFYRVCRITGERWSWRGLFAFQMGCALAVGALWRNERWISGVGGWLLVTAVVWVWIWRHYRRARPARWNPARIEAYAGFALSQAGFLLFAAAAAALALNALLALAQTAAQ